MFSDTSHLLLFTSKQTAIPCIVLLYDIYFGAESNPQPLPVIQQWKPLQHFVALKEKKIEKRSWQDPLVNQLPWFFLTQL